MTLEQLRALDAVVVSGSIRAASPKLHKTAPAISALIKNLESSMALQLLSRDGYRSTLTQQGEIFYAKARLLLQQADELSSLSQRIGGRQELLVNIAVNAVCPLEEILPSFSRIEAQFHTTQINVSSEHMGGAIERLRHGEADLAITWSEGMDMSTMEALPLFDVRIIPVAHQRHALSQIDRLITRQEARQYTQVIVRDSSRIDDKQSLDVVEQGRHCHVTEIGAKKAIIEACLGWGGLPEYVVREDVDRGQLRVLSVEGFEPRQTSLFLVRRKGGRHGPVAQEIWDSLKRKFSARA